MIFSIKTKFTTPAIKKNWMKILRDLKVKIEFTNLYKKKQKYRSKLNNKFGELQFEST